MFSDLCNLQLMSCRLIVISFVCVRVLRKLIKVCSLRIQGVQTIPRSRQCKLLTCADNCSLRTQGGRRGTRAVPSRWGTGLAACRPLCVQAAVSPSSLGVFIIAATLYMCICVYTCVYTHTCRCAHTYTAYTSEASLVKHLLPRQPSPPVLWEVGIMTHCTDGEADDACALGGCVC